MCCIYQPTQIKKKTSHLQPFSPGLTVSWLNKSPFKSKLHISTPVVVSSGSSRSHDPGRGDLLTESFLLITLSFKDIAVTNARERVVWNALAPNRQRTSLQRRSTAPEQRKGTKPYHITKATKSQTHNLTFLKCYSTTLRGYLVSQIRFWTLPKHLRDVEFPHPKRASRTPLGLILRGLLGDNQQMWWWSPRLPQFQMHLSVTPSRLIFSPTAAGLSMAPTATPATAGHLDDSSLIMFQSQSKILWGGNSSNS